MILTIDPNFRPGTSKYPPTVRMISSSQETPSFRIPILSNAVDGSELWRFSPPGMVIKTRRKER